MGVSLLKKTSQQIEVSRTYHFPSNEQVTLNHVVQIIGRDNGTHRLKTEDGKWHIIPAGWLHIELEVIELDCLITH